MKNSVTVSQEKLLQDTSGKLESVEKDLQSTQQRLVTTDEQVCLRFSCSFLHLSTRASPRLVQN